MKKFICIILVVCTIMSLLCIDVYASNPYYPSVKQIQSYLSEIMADEYLSEKKCPTDKALYEILKSKHWARESIKPFFDQKYLLIAEGDEYIYAGKNFKTGDLNKNITRAGFVYVLWEYLGGPSPKSFNEKLYKDMPADDGKIKAINWATENGITAGTGNGKFSPNALITREQAACFYRNFYKYCMAAKGCKENIPLMESKTVFSDMQSVSSWAIESINWCVSAGLISGCYNKGVYSISPKMNFSIGMTTMILSKVAKYIPGPFDFEISSDYRILEHFQNGRVKVHYERLDDYSDYTKYSFSLAPETSLYAAAENRHKVISIYKAFMYSLWEYNTDNYEVRARKEADNLIIYLRYRPAANQPIPLSSCNMYGVKLEKITQKDKRSIASVIIQVYQEQIVYGNSRQISYAVSEPIISLDDNDWKYYFWTIYSCQKYSIQENIYFEDVYHCNGLLRASASNNNIASISSKASSTYEKIKSLAAQIPSYSDKTKQLKAISDFIKNNYRYDISYTEKQDLATIVSDKRGCCGSLSMLFQALAAQKGIDADYCLGYSKTGYHAWNRVMIDGSYRYYDMAFYLGGTNYVGVTSLPHTLENYIPNIR